MVLQGTVVIPDVASVLYDPDHWETPHQFNPNHFLDKDGKFFCKEAFMPFAVGKCALSPTPAQKNARRCPTMYVTLCVSQTMAV